MRATNRTKEPLYHGCISQANIWIKLGLSPGQARILKGVAKSLFKPGKQTSANAAWHLLNVALSNIEVMEQLLRKELSGNEIMPDYFWEKKAAARLCHHN